MASEREPIGVIGTGYVGLVTAAGFAELGSDVHCIDIDAEKVEGLRQGRVPIYEPGLAEMVQRNRERMHFSTDVADALERARLLFVAVGTPPTYSGDADLSAVHAVVDAMPPSDRHALVMKSTVPVGTGAAIKRRFRETGKDGFRYVSCPEFLKEGSAVADFLHPDRVVVGDDGDWAGDAVVELYAPLDAELVRTDIASAEMVKLASNAFLATKISFINEIANVCEETGADVVEVARGMGLDDRIGPKFLQAGIGFGGSCLAPEERVLVRHRGRTRLVTLEQLWRRLEWDATEAQEGVLEPHALEVLSYVPELGDSLFLPVMCVTRREYEGELVTVRTKMGRAVTVTPDHPLLVSDGRGAEPERKLAGGVDTGDWLPLAVDRPAEGTATSVASVLAAVEAAELSADRLIVRPARAQLDALLARPVAERREVFARHRDAVARSGGVRRTGTLRLDELGRAGLSVEGARFGTASNGNFVPNELTIDAAFWRIVGLYLAEGCTVADGDRRRVTWSFHPENEPYLADEVVAYWMRHGIVARADRKPTSHVVSVGSRLLAAWWTGVLGLGRNAYEQRLPDLIWDQPDEMRWALLSGLFEGDGSWSLVNGGPSVVVELGTVSDELADGVLRLLGDLGVVASRRVGRTARSTKDTHWIRISGAEQVERAIALVPERDRVGVLASIGRQAKRIAPTGYRRFEEGTAFVRVTGVARRDHRGPVYSMEVPGPHTIVSSGAIALSNCFPKDVSALKQLAGNSGYHFQLLNAVIEVNELQKRRVIGKLVKHLGTLVGKRVALLGLAFKPNTDDMREASSLVLSARLQAAGASVVVYDPIAEREARRLIHGAEFAPGTLDCVRDADAVVLVTEWDEFRTLDWGEVAAAMAGRLVVDGRNALDQAVVEAAGLTYEGIGRGSPSAGGEPAAVA
ncbi:MAG TPA: nucleotide sugar dehydrogenase [Solirubrobacteraceae bacterium]|jgi:UDPglucose 6-dehydrogenase|nr:nucleotide sugar dehydrogenase [Solirubrobacteraceae bacterium]